MQKTVVLMMAIMLVGKVMGVLRDRMQATFFGAETAEAIAFAQASMLPRSFFEIAFAAAFSASFIPVFNSYMETRGKREAFELASLFISVVIVATVAVTVVAVAFSGPILVASLGGGDFPPGTIELGTRLLRAMFPLMVLSGVAFSFTGVVQSLGEFRVPAAMSIVSNGIILVYYFFFIERFGVYGLVVAFLLGWAAQGLIQAPILVKHQFRFRFRLDFKDPGLRQVGTLTLPVFAAAAVVPFNLMVNVRAAAGLYGGEFGVNAMQFAHGLYAIVGGILAMSVANVIFPKLSRQAAGEDAEGFGLVANGAVQVLVFFLVPLSVGMAMLAQPLVELVLGGGLFGERAVEITALALRGFAPGILGYGLIMILTRVCYAKMDGRTPVIAAAVAILANFGLSFALVGNMYIAGPALANAVGSSLGAAVLLVALTRKGVLRWRMEALLKLAAVVALAALMAVAVRFSVGWVDEAHLILQVAVPGVVGAGVYLTTGFVLLRRAWWRAVS
ncbi:MAG: murein biosynthesis integral membrane protein MurJ [Defluviitaleaceae bacterium]|nr:murein biosynthesis integral membrane protein MurJ [Defluviitaleaceae bacterium]